MQKLNENTVQSVKLDNKDIPTSEFNHILESLGKDERIVESSPNNYHTVKRLYD